MNITEIIEKLVLEFEMPPEEICGGYCADFASALYDDTAGKVSITDDLEMGSACYTHTFVEFEGRYYDPRFPLGVSDWRKLSFCGMNPEPVSP